MRQRCRDDGVQTNETETQTQVFHESRGNYMGEEMGLTVGGKGKVMGTQILYFSSMSNIYDKKQKMDY